MHLEYIILHSLYSYMFRHNKAIFREYMWSLQTLILNLIFIGPCIDNIFAEYN